MGVEELKRYYFINPQTVKTSRSKKSPNSTSLMQLHHERRMRFMCLHQHLWSSCCRRRRRRCIIGTKKTGHKMHTASPDDNTL